MPPVLRAIQGGLESMYRIDNDIDVCDFLVGSERRGACGVTRTPREQLLIRQSRDDLEIGLFVDHQTLDNLAVRDPRRRLDEDNFADFLLVLEGVSHFVYLVHRARAARTVSAVELELQAEVDKFVVALLMIWNQDGAAPAELRHRLYSGVNYADDLSPEESHRYRLANSAADHYARYLEARFVSNRAVDEMLAEVRRFYRKGLAGKLEHITQRAA